MASAKALSRYGQVLVWNIQACNMRQPFRNFCLFVFSLSKVCEGWLFWIVETNVVCVNGLGLRESFHSFLLPLPISLRFFLAITR